MFYNSISYFENGIASLSFVGHTRTERMEEKPLLMKEVLDIGNWLLAIGSFLISNVE
jgi:hypothetical protein